MRTITFCLTGRMLAVWSAMFNSLEALTGERKAKRILIIGCGNSSFTEELYNEGYTNITNIDISAVVISQCQQRYSHCEGVECER
jgi:spermidine synthase